MQTAVFQYRLDVPHASLAADLHARAAAAISASAHFRTRSLASSVACRVEDGAVVLDGAVPSWHHKQLAQQAVLGLEGLRGVRNRLTVVAR